MIHGGGHVMLSRKDVRPNQTQILLDAGFLPISIDYRLCPETSILEGPMTDVRDALQWVRTVLPSLSLRRPDIRFAGDKVVAVGWSTGGHLAMTLGWTAPAAGIAPPSAILAFYCPTDYEDPFWFRSNRPFDEATTGDYNLWDGVSDTPIVAYNPPPSRQAAGGWMSKSDARSRIALHMNWHGQTLPILIHGLKDKSKARDGKSILPRPTLEQIQSISPLAQIRGGRYRTPTFIVHPRQDDLIPWQQVQRTYEALIGNGVEGELRIVDDAVHLFDLYPRFDNHRQAMETVEAGYSFLRSYTSV